MKSSEAESALEQLGFGKYEAQAYVGLLRTSPLNGYELAKLSGVPRANVYAILQRLEERGAVIRVDSESGVRYAPVPPTELVQRLQTHYGDTLRLAQGSLESVSEQPETAYIWNAQGYPAMLEHARALLEASRESVLIATWPQEARALAEDFDRVQARGVEVTTLCLENCANECGNCRGHIYRYAVVPKQESRWLLVIPDGQELLAGEIADDDATLTVRTRQRLLVDLARWYIRHTIALAAVVNDLGDRLDDLLQPATRSILRAIGPDSRPDGWLKHMRRLLRRQGSAADGLPRLGQEEGL